MLEPARAEHGSMLEHTRLEGPPGSRLPSQPISVNGRPLQYIMAKRCGYFSLVGHYLGTPFLGSRRLAWDLPLNLEYRGKAENRARVPKKLGKGEKKQSRDF